MVVWRCAVWICGNAEVEGSGCVKVWWWCGCVVCEGLVVVWLCGCAKREYTGCVEVWWWCGCVAVLR